MRKILFGIVIAFFIIFVVQYCVHDKEETQKLQATSSLIEKQLENVGKLIVTEGNYAQVFSYEDSKKFYFDVFSARKKALVIVNAEAFISYDLRKIETQIDQENKTVTISKIPEPELKINPNIEYYDVQQDYLNQFEASDYNIIKKRVEASLREKIEKSELQTNAKNRLISELQTIYILTNSMGWTLMYNDTIVEDGSSFKDIKL
jgi:hypothetical protein